MGKVFCRIGSGSGVLHRIRLNILSNLDVGRRFVFTVPGQMSVLMGDRVRLKRKLIDIGLCGFIDIGKQSSRTVI